MLRQGATECADFFQNVHKIDKLRHLSNVINNAGFAMIQSARVGVGRFAETKRCALGTFP